MASPFSGMNKISLAYNYHVKWLLKLFINLLLQVKKIRHRTERNLLAKMYSTS